MTAKKNWSQCGCTGTNHLSLFVNNISKTYWIRDQPTRVNGSSIECVFVFAFSGDESTTTSFPRILSDWLVLSIAIVSTLRNVQARFCLCFLSFDVHEWWMGMWYALTFVHSNLCIGKCGDSVAQFLLLLRCLSSHNLQLGEVTEDSELLPTTRFLLYFHIYLSIAWKQESNGLIEMITDNRTNDKWFLTALERPNDLVENIRDSMQWLPIVRYNVPAAGT